ncbi:MAG TPA: hypothetical protein VHB72_04560 [Candidatus Saccharimonadales bacterium]|nr:hypothetical protein [Candidatus Saccharimonadales bacterium]
MSQNNEVVGDCFLQNIMISNGRWEDQAEEAGRKVVDALAAATQQNGDQLVTCERCETVFRVTPVGQLAGVALETDRKCEEPLGISGKEPARWQLNIYLGRLPTGAESK